MGETAKYTDKMSVRHILIVISGIMITFGCSALVFSTWSAFQAVVPEQLGVDTATWALYITVLYLAEAFSAPFIGKLLAKTDIRIVLSVSALLVGLGFILISIVKTLWIFYVAGLMMGLGEVGLLWLAVPTLCNKWFNKNSGTIIGACMAFTGIGGAIWLQVFNALNASGMDIWTIYMIWGIAALVTSLPFTLLCIRSTPEECGCLPYGAPQTASGKPAGLDAGKAMKSVAFYAVFLLAGIINLLTIVAQQFPKYTKSLDDGTGTDRQILSGIHKWYKPEELVGKTLVAIVNLPPRKMMGLESCGMLLSAVHTEKGEEVLNLIMVDDKIPAGAKLC